MGLKINGNILEKYDPEENAPDTIFIPDGVEIIGNSAFAQCTVKKIILPESVKEIRDSAFWQSWSEEINIPYGVKKIGKLAFCRNNIIKEINIPPNVTRIGENTFWNCSNVKKIRIPDTIKSINKTAFEDCRNDFELYHEDSLGEFRITVPFVSDWGNSIGAKVIQFICSIGTEKQESAFDTFEREELKLPLAIWIAVVHKSEKGKAYVNKRAMDAFKYVLMDNGNDSMLYDLLDIVPISQEQAFEIYSLALENEYELCAEIIHDVYFDGLKKDEIMEQHQENYTEENDSSCFPKAPKDIRPTIKLENGKKSPADLTIADDWCIYVPEGYLYSTDKNEYDEALLLTLQTPDCSETWIVRKSPSKVEGVEDLLAYSIQARIEHLVIGYNLSGDKNKEFVLRHESDFCIYCQLHDYDEGKNGLANAVYWLQMITLKAIYEFEIRFDKPVSQDEYQERIMRIAQSMCLKKENKAPAYMKHFMQLNKSLPVTKPKRPETWRMYNQMLQNMRGYANMMRLGMVINDSVEYGLLAIKYAKADDFPLAETAWKAAELFRVHEEYFDGRADRELELQHCYIREINYMQVFRTFVWLVGEYCEKNKCTPDKIQSDIVLALTQLAGSRRAGYDETHYPAICGVPDILTIYVKNGEGSEDLIYISDECIEDSDWVIADLKILQDELKEIYPCIEKIIEYIRISRTDTRKPLRGDHSDILYVWIAMTISAARAFTLTPDAPMNYFFNEDDRRTFSEFMECDGVDYIDFEDDIPMHFSDTYGDGMEDNDPELDETEGPEEDDEISSNHSKYTKNCTVVRRVPYLEDKTFVVSGISEDEVRDFLTERGAFLRKSISGKTDYLIVDPENAGQKKYEDVLEQEKKGHTVRIIFFDDFKEQMEETNECAENNDDSESGVHCTVPTPAVVRNDWVITIPAGYVYSTNSDIIGHRAIVFGLDDGTLDLSMPFNSTVNFSVTVPNDMDGTPMPNMSPTEIRKNTLLLGYDKIIRDDLDMSISFYVGNIEIVDDKPLCVSRGSIITRHNIYNFQFFDTLAKTQQEAEQRLCGLLMTVCTKAEYDREQAEDAARNAKVAEISSQLESINEQLKDGMADMKNFFEQQIQQMEENEREEAKKKEELERKKLSAKKNRNASEEEALMYVTILVDKANGRDLSDEDFYECYEEDFPSLETAETAQLRRKIMGEMNENAQRYEDVFRALPYDKRFDYTAKNLYNTHPWSGEPEDIESFIIETVSKWFSDSEMKKVRSDLKKLIDDERKSYDEQLSSVNAEWKQFTAAKNSLCISLFDKPVNSYKPENEFMIDCGNVFGSVQLATSGLFRMSAHLNNYFATYWNVTAADIWRAAKSNPVFDQREVSGDGQENVLAQQVFNMAMQKIGRSIASADRSDDILPSDDVRSLSHDQPNDSGNSTDQSLSEKQGNKKEGCYIATAVYGSYDAPEVLVLRRFRDNLLKKSLPGRAFIKVYYTLSPPLAKRLRNANYINKFVKKILDRWVEKL